MFGSYPDGVVFGFLSDEVVFLFWCGVIQDAEGNCIDGGHYDHLVEENTPGGMNEQAIANLVSDQTRHTRLSDLIEPVLVTSVMTVAWDLLKYSAETGHTAI